MVGAATTKGKRRGPGAAGTHAPPTGNPPEEPPPRAPGTAPWAAPTGDAHGRGGNDEGKAAGRGQRDDQRRPDGQLAEELRRDGRGDRPLGRAAVEVVDRLVDAAPHVAETVGGADDRVAREVEQVAR